MDVSRPHDALIEFGYVHKQLVQIDILLVVRADQIVKCVARDGQHRLAVTLRVVKTIQKVYATRARGSDAHSKPARILRVTAGGEGCGFFMPYLDELDFPLVRAQGFEDTVYTIARKAKNRVHAPPDQPLHQ